jgi:hypothetical protein
VRTSVIEAVELLSSPASQLAYEASLNRAGHAPTELVSNFCDDLYDPRDLVTCGEFSGDELRDLAHLYGLLVEANTDRHATVAAMLKDARWRRVIAVACNLLGRLGKSTAEPGAAADRGNGDGLPGH